VLLHSTRRDFLPVIALAKDRNSAAPIQGYAMIFRTILVLASPIKKPKKL
jgi:hypothetical protein